ncbi:glycoside hydrolase family 79 protein [Coniophora puteana RWD-64-598 SS2]|uniref:Glycoside hydrolase family 79 protein n=1 Tax=Coniophora puteana (strain RWD-64-598) TaxID=741705 RepID=A0A5M3ME23_CONPW|nr:glycoside hydrolase family 79 protein [Coniophora puteana RWD-64-598 SS2]EIW76865.1 glycoside hydrolase family 79 protein [Coniophora puteana RWD-64-598 SS2]
MSTQGSEYVATGATSGLSNLTLQGPPSLPMWATSPLNPALASFSIETAFFEEYMGNSSSPNTLSQALFENLSNRTGVPAEVRIGGITADSAFWDGNLNQALYNFIDSSGALINTTLGPAFWEVVELLPNETNIVFTLGLESLNYTGALYMAEAMWAGLRDSSVNISRFEIGNEPDQYSIHLNAQNYTEYWEPWSGNISKDLGVNYPEFQIGATAIDPLWPYNTSAADAQFDCVSALAAGADDGHTAKTCSEHTYQYSVCDPTRAAIATLPNLVNHTRLAMYLDLWQPRIHSVREQLGPDSFVIGEFNSVSCSGRDNVSNTFGQAMWLLDTTLYAASINVSRVYVHQGGPLALQSSTQLNHGGLSLYNLWYPIENQNGPIQVFPAYSAYLFVAEAIGHSTSLQIANIFPGRQANGSSITTADGDPSAGQVVVYGFWDETSSYGLNYPSKLALLNMQIYNQTDTGARPNVTFDILAYLPDANQVITAKRLTAPGADVKAANVTTWAGQNFASGYGEGQYVDETLSGGKIDVEASSAVLVFW